MLLACALLPGLGGAVKPLQEEEELMKELMNDEGVWKAAMSLPKSAQYMCYGGRYSVVEGEMKNSVKKSSVV